MAPRSDPDDPTDFFPPDYATARQRFRDGASTLGWTLESHPIDARGPAGELLTIDVAASPTPQPHAPALVVSSGLHGVEGPFGSAVQLAWMKRLAAAANPNERTHPVRFVFLHALNPYGFAHRRRFDEDNVDPNRNFLPEGEPFAGSPAGYAALDGLLNPARPPRRFEPFGVKAAVTVARRGLRAVRQAVAAGQYDYPRGLFYGGDGPSQSHRILAANLARWLAHAPNVMHLDFHTGLGKRADCRLLIDTPLTPLRRQRLADWFGAHAFEPCNTDGVAYESRGGLGPFCVASLPQADYLFACAEYGTYPAVHVLAGLRRENRAHHWAPPGSTALNLARNRLCELFVPASPHWRRTVLAHGLNLLDRAVAGLRTVTPDPASA
jgi:hypothetical protein